MRRVNFKRAIVWRGHSCISSCPLGSWALKSNEDEPGFAAHRAPKATGSESGSLWLGERRVSGARPAESASSASSQAVRSVIVPARDRPVSSPVG